MLILGPLFSSINWLYVALILIPAFVYLFFDGKGYIRIRISDTYFYMLFATFLFAPPDTALHFIFVFLWLWTFLFGTTAASNKRFPILYGNMIYYVNMVLITAFVLLFVKNISSIFSLNIAQYDIERQNIQISYFEYMFSKSLVFYVGLVLFSRAKILPSKLLVFGLVTIIAIATLQKSPVMYAFLSFIFFYQIGRSDRVRFTGVALFLVAILGIGTAMSLFLYGSDMGITIGAIIRRMLFLPGELSYATLRMLDAQGVFYLGGASFSSVFSALGLKSIYLGTATYAYVFGFVPKSASANSPALTSVYADFGYLGLIVPFALGYLFRALDNSFLWAKQQQGDLIFVKASFVLCITMVIKLNVTNLGTASLSEGLLASILLFYIALGKSSKFKATSKNKVPNQNPQHFPPQQVNTPQSYHDHL